MAWMGFTLPSALVMARSGSAWSQLGGGMRLAARPEGGGGRGGGAGGLGHGALHSARIARGSRWRSWRRCWLRLAGRWPPGCARADRGDRARRDRRLVAAGPAPCRRRWHAGTQLAPRVPVRWSSRSATGWRSRAWVLLFGPADRAARCCARDRADRRVALFDSFYPLGLAGVRRRSRGAAAAPGRGRAAGLGDRRAVPGRLRRGAGGAGAAVHVLRLSGRRAAGRAERLARRGHRAGRDLPARVPAGDRRAAVLGAPAGARCPAFLRGVNAAVVGLLLAALYSRSGPARSSAPPISAWGWWRSGCWCSGSCRRGWWSSAAAMAARCSPRYWLTGVRRAPARRVAV